jgi:hypothetical protein
MTTRGTEMKMPQETRSFFESVQGAADSQYNSYIQEELDALVARPIKAHDRDNTCLLTAIGDYLIHILDVTSLLADALISGEYIAEYLESRMQDAVDQPDFDLPDALHHRQTVLT